MEISKNPFFNLLTRYNPLIYFFSYLFVCSISISFYIFLIFLFPSLFFLSLYISVLTFSINFLSIAPYLVFAFLPFTALLIYRLFTAYVPFIYSFISYFLSYKILSIVLYKIRYQNFYLLWQSIINRKINVICNLFFYQSFSFYHLYFFIIHLLLYPSCLSISVFVPSSLPYHSFAFSFLSPFLLAFCPFSLSFFLLFFISFLSFNCKK